MISYKIKIEDLHSQAEGRIIREALYDAGADNVSVNAARRQIVVDSDLAVEDIYEIIEDAGFTPTDLELV
ncbi:MAG: hypothetical protein IKX74_00340 [Erysipelotrichaceae bacterium]|nr:hypothetical protein [Erysipelotrichaceae bacterium]MBR5048095.1 hypothetical protein [Erysipelotrichaceae bacterium]